MQTFPNPLWRRRLTTSWGAAGRLGVSPRGASVHRHYAVAVDRPAADRWLSDSERQACAALPWPERRPDWRAGRIAAKRAVARALGLDDPTRIELVPVSGGAPQLVLRGDDGSRRSAALTLSVSHRSGRAAPVAGLCARASVGSGDEGMTGRPGITAIAYALPACSRSVRELGAAGQLQTDPEVLENFGFGRVHIAVAESPYELAYRAAARLLEEQAVDAACAALVERVALRNCIAASVHVTKGYYWDGDALKNEIVASYFPTSKHVIERVIAAAGWNAADVDWIIPHNVSLRSWELLLSLLALPNTRLWTDNIARYGHSLAGDNFINLRDALDGGAVRPGQKLILFSYGYGAHWTALAVEA